MTFIVATNVIASRLPERRPTGTPHARAKRMSFLVATTSLPAVDLPNADRWKNACTCQNLEVLKVCLVSSSILFYVIPQDGMQWSISEIHRIIHIYAINY